MATSRIQVTEGSGKNIATNSFSEDAVTKELQRIVPNDSSGAELGTSSNPLTTKSATSATGTTSNVSGSASSVTLLSSNTSRKGATIVNDSSAILYIKTGTTASATSYTVKLSQDDYWEVPYGYTGRIDGIWASATGAARITEFT
jgi:hypothetical protein